MEYGIIIFSLFMALLAWHHYKDIMNPVTIFCALWGFITFLAKLQLYGLFVAEQRTFLIVFIGILFYTIGCAMPKIIRVRRNGNGRVRLQGAAQINDWILICFYVITVLFLLIDLLIVVPLLLSGVSLADIRRMLDDPNSALLIRRSAIEGILRNFISTPFSVIAYPIGLIYFRGKKRYGGFFLLSGVIITILRLMTDGGRIILIFAIIFTLAILRREAIVFVKNSYKKHKNKYKLGMVVFVALLIVLFIWSTTQRTSESIGQHLYYYLTMCFPYFDGKIIQIDSAGIHTWGAISLHGFTTPFLMLLKNLLGMPYPNWYQLAADWQNSFNESVQIASNRSLNAFSTLFSQMYLDAGVLGVIIISFLFGWTCKRAYQAFRSSNASPKDVAKYALLIVCIATSFVRLQFNQVLFAMGYLYINLFLSNEPINNR